MNKSVHNLGCLFVEIATANQEKPALKLLNGSCISYGQLNELSCKIANYLLKIGLKQGEVIAIFNNKTVEAYALMIACLKIGAVYSNLDYNSPLERLKKMIAICKPVLCFSESTYTENLKSCSVPENKIVDFNSNEFISNLNIHKSSLSDTYFNVPGIAPAYIMFTSGSTGFPKGVVIPHENILRFIAWTKIAYNTNIDDVFTNINPMHFDNSVFDFYASLFSGASLVPVTESLARNPRKLIDILNIIKPTIWFSVPSMLVYALKLRALNKNDLLCLRIVSFGGEGFPKNQLRNLWELWGNRIKFINVYGPTECTCICSSYEVTASDMQKDELLPLGEMLPGFGFLILDEFGKITDSGEIGELFITGPNVGLGYVNSLEQTAEVFVQHPFITDHKEIIYKSGDLVSINNVDKLLYFCGRKDNQIKRMGYRIELEEIEHAIGSLKYIEENAVVYVKSKQDIGKIVTFVSSNVNDENKITMDLLNLLPSYMIPDEYVFLEYLPKNMNGKIDRLKLKEEYSK